MTLKTLIHIVLMVCILVGGDLLTTGWKRLRDKKDEALGYLLLVLGGSLIAAGGYWVYEVTVDDNPTVLSFLLSEEEQARLAQKAGSLPSESKQQIPKNISTDEQVKDVSKTFLRAFLENDIQTVQQTSIIERRILTNIKLTEAVREYSRLINGSMELYNKSTGLNTQIKYGVSGYTAIDKTHAAVDMKIVLGPDTIYLPSITVVRKDTGWKVDFESFMITLHQSVGN